VRASAEAHDRLRKPPPQPSNDKLVERVARLADAWTMAGHATLATLERQVGLYRAALARAGKPFPPPLFRLTHQSLSCSRPP
jgi:hypothetical protein